MNRGNRPVRRSLAVSAGALGALLVSASAAWACSFISGTTEAYAERDSNGQEVSQLERTRQYHFRGDLPPRFPSYYYLYLLDTGGDCYTGSGTAVANLVGAQADDDGDIPPDPRNQVRQSRDGKETTIAASVPVGYPPGPAKLCWTDLDFNHTIPKSVTVV